MTTVECIHGLEAPLCDICYPRPVPAAAAPERPRAPRTSSATQVRTASGVTTSARTVPTGPPVVLATQRAIHVTHVDTLAEILADGALHADAEPPVDLSSAATRELRAETELPDGTLVGGRVAFFLAPEATRWAELRDGPVGPAWSDAARALRPTAELVALVTTAGALGADAVLTTGDAAATLTRFTVVGDDTAAATAALRRLHAEGGALPDAELLGPSEVPVGAFTLIVVPNEPVRERVRALLAGAGLRTKVAVNPPWFQPGAE